MSQKVSLENAICRAAIKWERKGGGEEFKKELISSVKAYTDFLFDSALPVDEVVPREEKPQASDPGVVSGYLR